MVANAVSQVTITETTSEATATVEYLDNSDATLTDADTMTADFQRNLSVGSNIVKVKVTAPDTTTTKTYTVNVFASPFPSRAAPPSMTNRIWTGNLTVGISSRWSPAIFGFYVIDVFGSLYDDASHDLEQQTTPLTAICTEFGAISSATGSLTVTFRVSGTADASTT